MKLNADQLPLSHQADVCIVGAGAAGIELADELSLMGHDVVLLESGNASFSNEVQQLHDIDCSGLPIRAGGFDFNTSMSTDYTGLPRVRQLGGTLNAWSGKWKPFDDDDLGEHPITGDAWPLNAAELAPSYQHIERKYGLPAGLHTGQNCPAVALPKPLGWSTHFEQVPPLRLCDRALEIARRRRLTLVTDAHVVGVYREKTRSRVAGVTLRTDDGKSHQVPAKAVVLAAGGLEVTRLLLLAERDGHVPHFPHLGTGFMDHPKVLWGTVRPRLRWARALREIAWPSVQGGQLRAGFGFQWEYRRKNGLPRHATLLVPRPAGSTGQRHPSLVRAREALSRSDARQALSSLAKAALSPIAARQALGAVTNRATGVVVEYEMQHYLEQLPNPASKLSLSNRRDRLGVPLLNVDWRLDASEEDRFASHVHAVKRVLEKANLAKVDLTNGIAFPDDLRDASHHMGTTRMTSQPSEGVVDANTRVHGVDNLFVSSSSVFPLGSSVNPTFTILALAHRLANHLDARLRGDSGLQNARAGE